MITNIFKNDTKECNSGGPTVALDSWSNTLQMLENNAVPLGNAFNSFLLAVAETKRNIIEGECNQDPSTCNYQSNIQDCKIIFLINLFIHSIFHQTVQETYQQLGFGLDTEVPK